jgi:hypothetical protein
MREQLSPHILVGHWQLKAEEVERETKHPLTGFLSEFDVDRQIKGLLGSTMCIQTQHWQYLPPAQYASQQPRDNLRRRQQAFCVATRSFGLCTTQFSL